MGINTLWTQLVDVLISGMIIGSTYAVMGMGMALIYGISKTFNFAYGAFFTWGAYFAWLLFIQFTGINYVLVFLIVIPIMLTFGWTTEKILIRPLRNRPEFGNAAMLITLGLAMFLDNLALVLFGPEGRALPPLLKGNINFAGFILNTHQIAMFISSIIIVVSLSLYLGKTRQGMAMRAVAQDIIGANIVGIKINHVFAQTFAISAVMVGLAGILLAPLYYITPLGGWEILIKAWIVTAVGGMGSLKGAFYAAFLLGFIEAFAGWLFGLTWVLFFWFGVFLIVLIFRPRGLIGTWG